MLDRIKLALSIFHTQSYVVLTDTKSVVMIPTVNLNAFDSILLLTGQTNALKEFQVRLGRLIKEHEQAIKNLR